jgi:hypothetical protein
MWWRPGIAFGSSNPWTALGASQQFVQLMVLFHLVDEFIAAIRPCSKNSGEHNEYEQPAQKISHGTMSTGHLRQLLIVPGVVIG